METGQEPLLDEIQWRSPQIVQSLQGGINTNTGESHTQTGHTTTAHATAVLQYFAYSPFFDATSNNAVLLNQASYNPQMAQQVQTREAFEGRLRSMQGVEFVVVQDPSNRGQQPEHSGVWVIRKQNRRKQQGFEDEVSPISLYFVVGENIYMAPSVGSILGSRLVWTVRLQAGLSLCLRCIAVDGHIFDEAHVICNLVFGLTQSHAVTTHPLQGVF